MGKKGVFAPIWLVPALVLALALPAAAQAGDRTMYAIEDDGNLVSFQRNKPEKLTMNKPITGLPAGVSLVGIDLRPKNGDLYGVERPGLDPRRTARGRRA